MILSLLPSEETLNPSGKNLVRLGSLSPSGEIICSTTYETINSSSEAFDLSDETSIEPPGKPYDKVSQVGYRLRLLGVIPESDPARENIKSFK